MTTEQFSIMMLCVGLIFAIAFGVPIFIYIYKNNKAEKKNLKIFRTIQLGTFYSIANLHEALKKGGFNIDYDWNDHDREWTNDLLNKTALVPIPITMNLVRLSVKDLGFPKGAIIQKIYKRAKKLGLNPCPAEVGPQLRLQYPDQPMHENLIIAMEPIITDLKYGMDIRPEHPHYHLIVNHDVFLLGHNFAGSFLGEACGELSWFYYAHEQLVFTPDKWTMAVPTIELKT